MKTRAIPYLLANKLLKRYIFSWFYNLNTKWVYQKAKSFSFIVHSSQELIELKKWPDG